jgi:hypothetical protein
MVDNFDRGQHSHAGAVAKTGFAVWLKELKHQN